MASKVLSGTSNPSYTNDTGQNVRIVINYLDNPTSVTWENIIVNNFRVFQSTVICTDPSTTSSAKYGFYTRTGGADSNIQNARQVVIKWDGQVVYNGSLPTKFATDGYITAGGYNYYPSTYRGSLGCPAPIGWYGPGGQDPANAFDVYRNDVNLQAFYPKQIMLNPGKSFSATCGAYNIVIIKEDGT